MITIHFLKKTVKVSIKFLVFLLRKKEILLIIAISCFIEGIMGLSLPYLSDFGSKVNTGLAIFGLIYTFYLNRDIQSEKIISAFREEVLSMRKNIDQVNSLQDQKLDSGAKILGEVSQTLKSHIQAIGHPETIEQVGELKALTARIDLRIDDLLSINLIKESINNLVQNQKEIKGFLHSKYGFNDRGLNNLCSSDDFTDSDDSDD